MPVIGYPWEPLMRLYWFIAALALTVFPFGAQAQNVKDVGPDQLPYAGETAAEAWADYRKARGVKAFALGQDGAWAWGRRVGEDETLGEARDAALENCRGETQFECFIFAENNIVVWTNPGLAALEVLPHVDAATRGIFQEKFLNATFNRAFAISPDGAFGGGWHSRKTMEEMRDAALGSCRKKSNYRTRNPCFLFMENDTVVWRE
jgi:hypothetical protein